jgi:aminopeptidase N/puromycin-sensitive aminopeptidase
VQTILGYAGRDPEVLAQAGKLAQQALDNPAAVDPTLSRTIFSLAALNGDASFYDQVLDHAKTAQNPQLYYLYSDTLGAFTDPKLLSRTLDYALSPEVRSQDAPHAIARVMQNPAGQRVSWDFVKAHWPEIEKMSGGFASGAIVASAGNFCDAGLRDEVTSFFSDHKVAGAERTVRQTVERMNGCVDLKTQQSAALAAWLQQSHSANAAGGH